MYAGKWKVFRCEIWTVYHFGKEGGQLDTDPDSIDTVVTGKPQCCNALLPSDPYPRGDSLGTESNIAQQRPQGDAPLDVHQQALIKTVSSFCQKRNQSQS